MTTGTSTTSSALKGERADILLLEDEKTYADLVVHRLKKVAWASVCVERAFDLDAALRALREKQFDLVIADLNLPDSAGIQTLRSLVSVTQLPIVVVTGSDVARLREQCMEEGAYGFLLKTRLDAEMLEDAIRNALTHSRALHALRRTKVDSEAKYRDLIEHAADGICVTDPGGNFILANSRYCEMLGYSEYELLAMNVSATFPEEEQKAARGRISRLKGARLYERMMRRKDGSLFPVEVSVRVLGDGTHYVVARDITERKAIENALRESENRFRETFELAASGISHIDLDGRFIRANPKMCEILGYSEQELIGRSVKDISHPEDRDLTDAARATVRSGEVPSASFEKRYVRKDGSMVWVSLTVALARDAHGAPSHEISIMEDITARKLAEQHISRLTRVQAVLSSINALIVRSRNRKLLLEQACNIAVENGKFLLAWIGLLNIDGSKIEIQASAGDATGYLELMPLDISAKLHGLNVAALSDRHPRVVNDIANDPRFTLTKQALERGFRSYASLPLIQEGKAVGLLALYADQSGFFDEQEMKLLLELAGDISFALEHISKAEKLEYLAYYDELTGLTNATLLRERIAQKFSSTERERRKFAVAMFNIERFRSINDTFGRRAGDELLRQVAKRFIAASADPKLAARIGADVFALVVPAFKDEEDLARIVERAQQQVTLEEFALEDTRLRISTKAGIALFPSDGVDPDTLLRNAEAALKRARVGADAYVFYAPDMTARVAEKLALENKLRRALENEEFVLHYQPKLEAASGIVVGVEALIRWRNPEVGMVPPMDFIPLLEETGLILPVGAWALRKAAADHRQWVARGHKNVRVAVNVSPIQLRRRDFVGMLQQALMEGMAPVGLDLEITESVIMDDVEANTAKLAEVRKLGVHIAIDDFGTGYSSLGYLAKLPVQSLKIDRAFISSLRNDGKGATLVHSIISLAHSLGLRVVAEGVETVEQANFLRARQCEELQGYLFSKPLPLDNLLKFLETSTP